MMEETTPRTSAKWKPTTTFASEMGLKEGGKLDQELTDGAELTLDQTGRNPEGEEVLGALSLILNGGGVAQLKTIATEVNKALGGREGATRSVLVHIRQFMAQLDANKADIVDAIESVNRLAKSVRKQQSSIDSALEELPSALTSLDQQRGDLVKMLRSLGTAEITESQVAPGLPAGAEVGPVPVWNSPNSPV